MYATAIAQWPVERPVEWLVEMGPGWSAGALQQANHPGSRLEKVLSLTNMVRARGHSLSNDGGQQARYAG
jgi:hypothetical protein